MPNFLIYDDNNVVVVFVAVVVIVVSKQYYGIKICHLGNTQCVVWKLSKYVWDLSAQIFARTVVVY